MLTKGSKLVIHWHGENITRKPNAVVQVTSRLGTVWRRLQPELIRSQGRMEAILTASVVVPRGKVLLECILEGSATKAWQRNVYANKPAQTVEVSER